MNDSALAIWSIDYRKVTIEVKFKRVSLNSEIMSSYFFLTLEEDCSH